MGIERVKEYFRAWNKENAIIEFQVSSATVELAALALHVDGARIAKTLSFKIGEKPVLIVCAGDARIDNKKYKEFFKCKAKMLTPDEVKTLVGYEIGGVCPFAVYDGVAVYLDQSLKRFATVFPACGSANSAIELSCDELAMLAKPESWIDVCAIRDE